MFTPERGARQGLDLLRGGFFSALVKAEAGQKPRRWVLVRSQVRTPNV